MMEITYYGVRGSIPSPKTPEMIYSKIKKVLKEIVNNNEYKGLSVSDALKKIPFHMKSTYGGNTPCVLVKINNEYLIFDAGSGLRELGIDLIKTEFGKGKGKAKIFFSHTHWDHIQGLPFFIPIFIPGNEIEFYSIYDDLEERLKYQLDFKFFPVSFDKMPSNKKFFKLEIDKKNEFGKYSISLKNQNHPGGSVAYKIESGNKIFIYSTDVEYNQTNIDDLNTSIKFYKDADVLTFDSQYTLVEAFSKIDWGHSSIQLGIDIAKNARIKNIVLFHYDPTYSDAAIDEIIRIAKEYKKSISPDCDFNIIASYEGLILKL